jgi:hypothetical protein
MGNLGDYQLMTTLAKKVGGPKVLAVAFAALGYVVMRPAEAGVKKAIKTFNESGSPHPLNGRVFLVTCAGDDGHGLELHEGDQYRILEGDGNAILIEVLGGSNNPYVVSGDFLRLVSDFRDEPSR